MTILGIVAAALLTAWIFSQIEIEAYRANIMNDDHREDEEND